MSHWKVYDPIASTVQFDEQGNGPIIACIEITANVHPSEAFSEQRIALVIGTIAAVGMTVAQSAALRTQLQLAEDAVAVAVPEPMPPAVQATMPEGRCESCCREIRTGEFVHMYGMEVVHAGPCPREELGHG